MDQSELRRMQLAKALQGANAQNLPVMQPPPANPAAAPAWAQDAVRGAFQPVADAGNYVGGLMQGTEQFQPSSALQHGTALAMALMGPKVGPRGLFGSTSNVFNPADPGHVAAMALQTANGNVKKAIALLGEQRHAGLDDPAASLPDAAHAMLTNFEAIRMIQSGERVPTINTMRQIGKQSENVSGGQ